MTDQMNKHIKFIRPEHIICQMHTIRYFLVEIQARETSENIDFNSIMYTNVGK